MIPLQELCANRSNPTVDVFHGNGYYGMADVYKAYASVPVETPLNGIMPHGVSLSNTWFWQAEAEAKLPYVYCYPKLRQAVYKKHTNKKIILSASPFIYVKTMLEDEPKPERNGTLFFPIHSSKCLKMHQDYDELAEQLLALDECYQPVDVCIYWRDYLAGAAEPFLQRGIKVVSAGHIYDRAFLYRLYMLLLQYQYVSGNELGSHVFYAVSSGCSYFNIDIPYNIIASAYAMRHSWEGIKTKRWNDIRKAFTVPVETPTKKQQEMVNHYLGTAYFKTRKTVRKEILQ